MAAGFAALPVGVPKMIVSTMASGRVDGYVGATDLILVPSLVDVAGLNRVLRPILRRAAAAMAGMVLAPTAGDETNGKPVVGMTMFGVTTPSVTGLRGIVEAAGWEPMVFHATGTGGKIMERLVASGSIAGVIDATTTEVADEIVGGVMPGGPFVTFPLVITFSKAGAGVAQMTALLTAWSVYAMHRILTWEYPVLGWRFVALRLASSFFLPVLAGLIMQALLPFFAINLAAP